MVARGRAFLEGKGHAHARLEAELLVAHVLGLDRMRLFLELDRPVGRDEVDRARELFVRRARGEPVAYLTGEREFYGRAFHVGPGVLVPRPETELLVDVARERLAARAAHGLRIADVGTGSGCLAVTLALELGGASVVGVDVSERALGYARENAERHGASVELVAGDGLAPLEGRGPFDLVLSNPPYVAPDDPALEEGVRAFEPPEALFAPPDDPLHWVRRLCAEAPPLLAPSGLLLVELGHDQGHAAVTLARERGLDARVHRDLAGVARVLEARPTPADRPT